MFLVPQGQDPGLYAAGPSMIALHRDESITFEAFVENTAEPFLLRAYGVKLDSATGGDTGSVDYVVGSIFGDVTRTDWVFYPIVCGFSCIVVNQGPPALFGSGWGTQPVDEPKYLGELSYHASDDASGSFLIEFIEPGVTFGTTLRDPGYVLIDFIPEQTIISILCPFGDTNANFRVDLDDILCVIDGFVAEGTWMDVCPQADLWDTAGGACGSDGDVTLDDILAVIDSFSGNAPCPDPPCPAQ